MLTLAVNLVSGGAPVHAATQAAQDPCASPANPIVAENCLPGTPEDQWAISGDGDETIQGFATDISVNVGSTVSFKINTNANAYTIDIYRMGWYGGDGARKVTSILPSVSLPQHQPACLSNSTTGLVDCGNWAVSASWTVPSTAVSGVYFAELTRTDTGGQSQIFFVVRNDASHSALLYQTSDSTWEAYNSYGGNSLYTGNTPQGRAYKVSYNRPFDTRQYQATSFIFNAEYPMIRWLERNGYDVSYFTDVDTDRYGALLKNHKTFLSVGHDEYWSNQQRANVTAARDAGVNLAFFSGNEVFWKTRYENSIDGTNTAYRTLVCYKESQAGQPIDPQDPPTWTGTWRDKRFSPPADGGRPENALTGTIFMVNSTRNDPMYVPYSDANLRFWRNTSIANLQPGQQATLPAGVLGYEWDEDLDNGSRPPGLIDMSSTTLTVGSLILDQYGIAAGTGTATHSLTLYRAASGALVFGAGTVQWSWGLDADHDFAGTPVSPDMQQATVNLLADMGAQPGTLQSNLVPASASTDTTPPTAVVTSPAPGSTVQAQANTPVTVSGTATDAGGGVVAGIEVSIDNGATWHPAQGRASWSYKWTPQGVGQQTFEVRAIDDSGNIEAPVSATYNIIGPTCPCSIWPTSATPSVTAVSDTGMVELGVKFQSSAAGYVTGIRFYKGSTNTGAHTGSLWDMNGNRLATATFTNETSSGWQEVDFASPVAISPNTVYIASYYTPTGHFAVDRPYFTTQYNALPLYALADGQVGHNGVYHTGSSGFPTESYDSSNYWVTPVFTTTYDPGTEPPYVVGVTPAQGATNVSQTPTISVSFSKAMNASTITTSTLQLLDATGTPVNASVSYDSATNSATLTPAASLNSGTMYTVNALGGANGVQDTSGQSIPATYTWTFTTSGSPTVVSVTPTDQATGVNVQPTIGITFSEPMTAGTVTSATVTLKDASGSSIPLSVTYQSATHSATATLSSELTLGATYTATVLGGSGGVQSAAGATLTSSKIWTFTVKTCPCTLWSDSAVPTTTAAPDTGSYELGMRFRSEVSGYITGVRFYKGTGNTGQHLGHLWDNNGNMLAEVLFTNESATGWQTAYFPAPVAVTANTTYVISYYAPNGHFAVDRPYFVTPYNNPPLHGLADGQDGANGVYNAGSSAFPTSTYLSSNYWVDAIFTATVSQDTTPPTVTNVTPAANATGVSPSSNVTVTFSKAMNPTTITTSTVSLLNSSNTAVAATVTYNSLTYTATLTPAAPLTIGATYTLRVAGGSGGVQSLSGVNMASTYTSAFTVKTCPCTLWDSTVTPSTVDTTDAGPIELGVRFTSDISGYVTGIRYYKGPTNTGVHTGSLWDANGTQLATATFTSETSSGWQEVDFATPVAITANTVYIASYFTPSGYFAVDRPYFTDTYDNSPLHAPADGANGGSNGVYNIGGSGFPTSSYDSSNYWVEPIFSPTP